MVDTISSLASTDYRHDEWGVDVTVGGAQKGLMLPPGMSFNAISDKAIAASKTSKLPKSFFAWDDMLNMNKVGFFPYTPATPMLQGLAVAIDMLHEEGLDNVFARHHRLAEATRRAIAAWGLENLNKNASQYSPTITAVMLPEGHNADQFRALALETFNISYGASFGAYAGKYFRIGHLGDINDTMLMGGLAATEMGAAARGRADQEGRRAGGDGLSRLRARRRQEAGGGVSERRSDDLCKWPASSPAISFHGAILILLARLSGIADARCPACTAMPCMPRCSTQSIRNTRATKSAIVVQRHLGRLALRRVLRARQAARLRPGNNIPARPPRSASPCRTGRPRPARSESARGCRPVAR